MNSANEQLLRSIFSSIQEYAIFATNEDGVVIACNAGVTGLLGYSREEFLGMPTSRIFTREDRLAGAPEREFVIARETGRAADDRWHVRKDGGRVWVKGVMTELRDESGERRGFVKVMRDRTEARETRLALEESEARYRSLLDDVLDTSTVGVFILDARFEVVWVNRAVEEYFGLQREEVIGSSKRDLLRTRLEPLVDRPDDFVERLLAAYRDNSTAVRFEVHLRGVADDDDLWLEHRSQPIDSGPFAGGRIEHYYDITVRKRYEEALADARDALESQVEERTADLVALNSELETFNYSVSHDLRAPLRGLSGFSQILLQEYGDRLDESARHYLDRVNSAAVRMGELIDALLALSDVARYELRVDELDLSAMAETIAGNLQERHPGREVSFEAEAGVTAWGDERLLRIALENLLENAWKFTAGSEAAQVRFGVRRTGPEDAYFVQDTGAGFDMEYASKLFEPFQRLHSPRSFRGLGIGLSTVQRIVHRHGGEVWGEGEVGRGATICFTLPRGDEEAGPDEEPNSKDRRAG